MTLIPLFALIVAWRCRTFKAAAHAAMLCSIGILTTDEHQIETGLNGIAAEIANGTLPLILRQKTFICFIEAELTARIGEAGKKLHTGRSRNDQVATDLKLWLRDASSDFKADLIELLETIFELASVHVNTIMPGYTHLQRAQPITFGYHLMAYGQMFLRDLDRLEDAVIRMNISPLGNGALAGTTYPLDREQTAADLGFNITLNAWTAYPTGITPWNWFCPGSLYGSYFPFQRRDHSMVQSI